jgi:sulfide:quinone oxidoreductase
VVVSATVILGGGFGGVSVATELRRLLGDGHRIVLIDRSERFVMGLRKIWELVGHATLADGSRPLRMLADRGIEVVHGEIRAIDPDARAAETDHGRVAGDHLVVALGAVARPDLVPGLAGNGHDVWSADRVPAAAQAFARLDGGRVVMLVAGAPYPCPPAPFECAMHMHESLRRRGLRDRTEIEVVTVQPMLMPNAGRVGSDWMAARLQERGIAWRTGAVVERVEPERLVLADGTVDADLLLAVPPHRPPPIVAAGGLAGEDEWIEVDPGTLETARPGVYAIGDVTGIRLANGLPLPKAGLIADLEGRRVAAAIAAELRREPAPPPFDGEGQCFVETGPDEAGLVDGRFYATPEPRVVLRDVDAVHAAEKRRFESERLSAWFGG